MTAPNYSSYDSNYNVEFIKQKRHPKTSVEFRQQSGKGVLGFLLQSSLVLQGLWKEVLENLRTQN